MIEREIQSVSRGKIRPRPRGFSLVELMVVLGIIALLAVLLLPTVSRAREAARRVECLSHIRSLTQAVLIYAADNDGFLPDAVTSNSGVDQLSPIAKGKPPGTVLPDKTYIMPSIGAMIVKYLSADTDVWRCPSAPLGSCVITGPHPYTATRALEVPGQTQLNQFSPNYDYLSAKQYIIGALQLGPLVDATKLRAWAARNVSGLRADRIAPLGGAGGVVIFHDLDSAYHTQRRATSIYTSSDNWRYFANFGYLDGHAEGHEYRNVDEYLALIHGPIRQSWFGIDFPSALPEQYAGH
jgi:prepilin-type N-terminal cleavage/methylation domain-containing protein/prepilin-type processing-associated H-X9-DG protein